MGIEDHVTRAIVWLPTNVIIQIMWTMAHLRTSTQTLDLLLALASTHPHQADIHMVVNNLDARATSAREPLAYVVAIFQQCRKRS